jgi:hypothetical protein
MKKLVFFLMLPFCLTWSTSQGQKNIRDSLISTSLLSCSYAYQYPGGDLDKRFYSNNAIGGSYLFKTKHNWLVGVNGFFMFRDKIKETGLFQSISTSNGYIIDGNGIYAEVRLYERGFYGGAQLGKIFPVLGPNKNSGILLMAGTGLLQHKIRIENPDNTAPQIKGDYKKGYDRLTNGLAVNEFIGYMYLGNSRLVSFYAGFEFTQAWTQNRRSYNFDLMGPDNTKRMDLLSSFKIGWVIPLYKRAPEKYYYF